MSIRIPIDAAASIVRAILAIQFFDALLLLLICRKGYSCDPDSVLLSRVNALLLSLLLLLLLLLIGLSRNPGREGYIVIVDAIQVDTLSWRIPCCCCC